MEKPKIIRAKTIGNNNYDRDSYNLIIAGHNNFTQSGFDSTNQADR